MKDSQLHHSRELDQLKSVWVKKHHENQLLVGGVINAFTVLGLRKESESWIKRLSKSYQTVEFDMEPSDPQGTVCVSFILCLYRYAEKLKLNLEFTNVPDRLLRIVALSGMTDILKLTPPKETKA